MAVGGSGKEGQGPGGQRGGPSGTRVGRGHGGVQKMEPETGLQTLTWVPGAEKEMREAG